ncbi:Ig-like domain-containing protein, partial [Pseudomonas rhodesiae]|uniref:Ig-like domain-containing protein n=1 Tax=Pseudomonas rhodesiae TaxID=76760 RepID=UPI002B1CFC72
GATVQVRNDEGLVIGTGTVAVNGTFVVSLDAPLAAGQAISLVQTDAAGNTSTVIDVTVSQAPVPASPTDIVVAGDGTSVSGTAPGNAQV